MSVWLTYKYSLSHGVWLQALFTEANNRMQSKAKQDAAAKAKEVSTEPSPTQ